MKLNLLPLALTSLTGLAAFAQEGTPTNSLARAQSTFSAADADKDGRLAVSESRSIPLTAEAFQAQDLDKDGFWSRDEFLQFYRQRLVSGGQTVGADLEAEVARIQALRRARGVEEARKRAQDAVEAEKTEGRAAGAATASESEDAITVRLTNALSDLEKRAAAAQATPEDFQRVRNLLITRARAASTASAGSGAGASEDAGLQSAAYRKMSQSLERLEKLAAEGKYSREEFEVLRGMIVRRARQIQAEPAGGSGSVPASDAGKVEEGLLNALEQLEKRAAAGGATREDFQRVRDQLTARARAAASGAPAEPVTGGETASDAYRKMIQSLDRLEQRAAEGQYPREDYQALRELVVRRARAIEAAQGASAVGTPTAIPSDAAGIEVGLKTALDQLEQRAAAGGATRADFQRVRDLLAARARAASAGGAQPGATPEAAPSFETSIKLLQSLDRLERAAAEGQYSREEYQAIRDLMIHRARVIETSANASADGPGAARRKAAGGEDKGGSGAPRDPSARPTSPPARDPEAPGRTRPAGETPAGEAPKRPAPQPAPTPPPQPQRPTEKEKPPPPRPPQAPPPGERPRG